MAISYEGPPPASTAWREGEDPGDRRFADLGGFDLEFGGRLPGVRGAYETFGELAEDRSNPPRSANRRSPGSSPSRQAVLAGGGPS